MLLKLAMAAVAVFFVVSGNGHASAKSLPDEQAWAQCLWENVPTTAKNYLDISKKDSDIFSSDRTVSELLEYRLQGACYRQLVPAGKEKSLKFNAAKVRIALIATRPAIIVQDKVEAKAFSCTRFFENDVEMKYPAEYIWGFGDFIDGVIFSNVGIEYNDGRPQGVRLAKTGGLRKCRLINNDGTLTDA